MFRQKNLKALKKIDVIIIDKDFTSLQTCNPKTICICNYIKNIKVSMANWDPKISIHLEEEGKTDYEEYFFVTKKGYV